MAYEDIGRDYWIMLLRKYRRALSGEAYQGKEIVCGISSVGLHSGLFEKRCHRGCGLSAEIPFFIGKLSGIRPPPHPSARSNQIKAMAPNPVLIRRCVVVA
jgi:hypothetical protein